MSTTGSAPTLTEGQATAPALPDAPVALLRLDREGRIVAANRAASDLLGLEDAVLPVPASGPLWGLDVGELARAGGVWAAPGDDPARRLRYQADDEGWIVSLPHAETATLMREAALLAGNTGASVTHPLLAPLAQGLAGASTPLALLAHVNDTLARCDLALALPAAHAEREAGRRVPGAGPAAAGRPIPGTWQRRGGGACCCRYSRPPKGPRSGARATRGRSSPARRPGPWRRCRPPPGACARTWTRCAASWRKCARRRCAPTPTPVVAARPPAPWPRRWNRSRRGRRALARSSR